MSAMSEVEQQPLPEGWRWVKLREVAEVRPGQSPPGASYNSMGVGEPFHQGKTEFGAKYIGAATKWTTEPRRFADAGEIVMSVRAPVGPVNLIKERIAIGRGLGAIKPIRGELMTMFAFYYLRLTEPTITGNTGSVFASINKREIESINIPLPPLTEQQRIVRVLDEKLALVEQAKQAAEAQLEATNACRTAYLREGIPYTDGDELPTDWRWVKLGTNGIFRVESGGTPKSNVKEYWNGSVPWITLADLPAGDFITQIVSTNRTISDHGLNHSAATMLPAGSIVVSSRATIGRIGINRIPLSTNQGFKNVVIEDSTEATAEYVAYALTLLVPQMEELGSGSTYKEIVKSKFRELTIPLPPLAEQQRIVRVLDDKLALVEQAKRTAEAQLEATNALSGAYLREAFAGEL